jgi:hypothetical protein
MLIAADKTTNAAKRTNDLAGWACQPVRRAGTAAYARVSAGEIPESVGFTAANCDASVDAVAGGVADPVTAGDTE